jgi:DNA-directed RNA polymerase specialized sigma24 family protein
VSRYAYRTVGVREDAEDIGQETVGRAFQAIAAFRGERSLWV